MRRAKRKPRNATAPQLPNVVRGRDPVSGYQWAVASHCGAHGPAFRVAVFSNTPTARRRCESLRDSIAATFAPAGYAVRGVDAFPSAFGWECVLEMTAVTSAKWGVA